MRSRLGREELRRRLRSIEILAVDVDGTLTDREQTLYAPVIEAVRALERVGVKVVLVSGNVLPVVGALAVYFKTCGWVIAENGCVIGHRYRLIWKCDAPLPRDAIKRVMLRLGFIEAYTNPYRWSDLAFLRTEKSRDVTVDVIIRELEREGVRDVDVVDTQFAIHIGPKGVDKGFGLRKLADILNVPLSRVCAMGDADNDRPMLEVAGLAVVPSNATSLAKEVAHVVLDRPDGEAFCELARMILEARRA